MNLSYREDYLYNEKVRRAGRDLLSEASLWIGDRSALDRLSAGKTVPAKKVLFELQQLRAAVVFGSILLRHRELTVEAVDAFLAYVQAEVAREAVDAQANRLVKAAMAAGYDYGTAQSMFVRALDRWDRKQWKAAGRAPWTPEP